MGFLFRGQGDWAKRYHRDVFSMSASLNTFRQKLNFIHSSVGVGRFIDKEGHRREMWILTKKGHGAGKAGIHLAPFFLGGDYLCIFSVLLIHFFAVSSFVYFRTNLDSP